MSESRVKILEVSELIDELLARLRLCQELQEPLPPVGSDEGPDEALFMKIATLVRTGHGGQTPSPSPSFPHICDHRPTIDVTSALTRTQAS